MKKFLDLSEYNTINNYNALCLENLGGVILKATEGVTFDDSSFEGKYFSLEGKIQLGAYHYLTSTSDARLQADHFYNRIKDKLFQIKHILDVEQYALGELAETFSKEFLERFKELSGQDMIIYSGRCYIESHFSDEFRKNNIFWVADYSANDIPTIENCNVIAWQYTETCQDYNSIFGGVDCNLLVNEELFYIDENVSRETLTESTNEINLYVVDLQEELNRQGFTDKNGNILIVDGVAGELTLSACPTLKLGAIGNITAWVQQQLGIITDGIFGDVTEQAVIAFQENHSLDGDGVVGKLTWSKIF